MATANPSTAGSATHSDTQDPEDILPSLAELFDPSVHDMCEFGDIMLVIEDGFHPQLKIKASSCILASTSKVFRTLFRGCFIEGEAIRAGTREIYMNDNPAPMLALCQLLHLKPVEPAVRERDVLEFALLVDKFDCIQALKPATDSMLGQMTLSGPYSFDLIVSAFILDQPKHFRSSTKALVLYSQDLDPAGVTNDLVREHLPEEFMTSISHQHDAVRKELVHCITNLLDQFEKISHESDEFELVHDLMAAMRSSGLWPIWPSGGRSKPLQEQLAALSSLEIPIISDALVRHRHGFKSRSSHVTPLTSRDVISLSEKLKDLCEGLCLDCLKRPDRCGRDLENHMGPWGTYEDEREEIFEQRSRSPSIPRSLISARARSPSVVFLDGMGAGGGWGPY